MEKGRETSIDWGFGSDVLREDPFESGHYSKVSLITLSNGSRMVSRANRNQGIKDFLAEVAITDLMANHKLGPRRLDKDLGEKAMLLDYVEHTPLKVGSEDPGQYKEVMKTLKQAHAVLDLSSGTTSLAPFTVMNEYTNQVGIQDWVPQAFYDTIKQVNDLFDKFQFLLAKDAVVCHGDFTPYNFLYGVDGRVKLIDWTEMVEGHPFFDVTKFTIRLPRAERLRLLNDYLGRKATEEEVQIHDLVDLSLLMLIVANRYCLAVQEIAKGDNDVLSQEELNAILAKEEVESFLKTPFGDESARARQDAGTRALWLARRNIQVFSKAISSMKAPVDESVAGKKAASE
ncbi:MAG: hypothetical protein S4CHLAM20_06980 [Chlamydiia bacterium]|nr:hypothetical protein [Chlamydiia bacterium]